MCIDLKKMSHSHLHLMLGDQAVEAVQHYKYHGAVINGKLWMWFYKKKKHISLF